MNNLESQPNNISGERVPEKLLEHDQWICWRYEQVDDKKKKPPYDPKTGRKCDANDPDSWADFETALEQFRDEKYDGIGFVLTEDDPFVGVDFDDCRDAETGETASEVEAVVERLDSYTEASPSEEGLHTLAIGEKPEGYGSKGGKYIEIYHSGRYFTVTGDHLDGTPETIELREDEIQRVCETYLNETGSEEVEDIEIPDADIDTGAIETGEQALECLQEESVATFNVVMDFLQGGIADFDDENLRKESGRIDRSAADYTALSLLYNTMSRYLDRDEADLREIVYQTYTYYCQNHRMMNDNRKRRRWLTDDTGYRRGRLKRAIPNADPNKFEVMVEHKTTGMRRENNEYSQMTYDAIWDALYELLPDNPPTLSKDMDPANPETEATGIGGGRIPVHECYPGKDAVLDRAVELDNGYNEWGSYEEAFRRLQSNLGEVKAARIGNEWVYYPKGYPDPPEANYVLQYGESYDPNEADRINSWTEEPEEYGVDTGDPMLMTDGGIDVGNSESHDKLERIRRARNGADSPTDGPEVYTCPVEECGRAVIDNPGDLRSHVRQSNDDIHRYKTLNDDLEIEMAWDQMSWDPGLAPKSEV